MPATVDVVNPLGTSGPGAILGPGLNAATSRLFNPQAPGHNALSDPLFNPESNPNTWRRTLGTTAGTGRAVGPNVGYGVAPGATYARPGAVGSVFDMTRIGMQQAQMDPNYRGLVAAASGRPYISSEAAATIPRRA